nr:hypothetical protein [Tanacetum cinerariifolium]
MINDDIKLSAVYKTYLDYATGKVPLKKERKFKNHASPKLKTVPVSPKEPTQKDKRVKRPSKKATTTPTICVFIRDTPGKSVSKKKAPAKSDRGKGVELLSDAALLEDAQLKKTLRKRKQETHRLQASDSSEGDDFESEVPDEQTGKTKDTSEGTSVEPRVPDVSKEDSSDSDDDSWGDSEGESDDVHDEDDNDDDDGNDDDSDNDDDNGITDDDGEKEKSDDEEKMYEEEDDDVTKELYEDLNITQGLKDADMTNVEQGGENQQNASHESGFMHKEEDAHVTLTTVYDKTEGPLKSSYVSSDFTSKLLNLDNTGPDVNEIASLMNTSIVPPPPPPVNPSSHLPTIPQQQTQDSTTTTTNPTMTLQEIPNFVSLFQFDQRNLYNALVEAYNSDKNIITLYGDVGTLKRGRDDQDKNEDPFAGSNRGTKRKKSSKDDEPSKGSKSKESNSFSSFKGTQSQPKPSSKSTQAKEPVCETVDIEMQYDQGNEFGHPDHEPDKPPTPDRAWNKLKSVDFKPPHKWICTIANNVTKDDNVLYKFKEGNFPRLNQRDIKDMLLLLVQKKLSNLDVDDWYDLRMVLRMFTRRIVILHHVEDL